MKWKKPRETTEEKIMNILKSNERTNALNAKVVSGMGGHSHAPAGSTTQPTAANSVLPETNNNNNLPQDTNKSSKKLEYERKPSVKGHFWTSPMLRHYALTKGYNNP